MKCNLTKECPGNMELLPEQDDAILCSWVCDHCLETKIEQRTSEQLISLYDGRIKDLKAGLNIQDIYAREARELLNSLSGMSDGDLLKYGSIAEYLIEKNFKGASNGQH